MTRDELHGRLGELLEKIAIEIHVANEGAVDLRKFAVQERDATQFLWDASDPDPSGGDSEDAGARIGSRSLLRRVDPENEERWLVDFFHRSMKEYFVAKALRRALNSPDSSAARELLLNVPIQPEILGFFHLLTGPDRKSADTLEGLVRSAKVGSDSGPLGGSAISLYHAAGGKLARAKWKGLQLDGALLSGADLSGSDFRKSTLRAADLSSVDLTGTDLRSAILTGANLDAGASIIALAPDASGRRFLSLTRDCELGWVTVKAGGPLSFSALPLSRKLRWPESVYLLRDRIVLVTARSEFLIVDISKTATEVAYFRVSGALRNAAIIHQKDQELLGFLHDPEHGASEALLIDIDNGRMRWRVPVEPNGGARHWSADGVVIAYGSRLMLFREEESQEIWHGNLEDPVAAICVEGNQAVVVTEHGHETWISLTSTEDTEDTERTVDVHDAAGSALAAVNGRVLSAAADGSVALTRREANGDPVVMTQTTRTPRCVGAKIEGLESAREQEILIRYGAR